MLDKKVKVILASYLSAKEELGKIAPTFNWSNLLGDYGEYIAINEFEFCHQMILKNLFSCFQEIVQTVPSTTSTLLETTEHRKAKVLILGAAESGKSTICRHMRQLHGEKFGDSELLHFKQTIRASCLEYFISTVSDLLETPLVSKDREECLDLVEYYRASSDIDP